MSAPAAPPHPSVHWHPALGTPGDAAELGGKGYNLARLTEAGCRVPPCFVLTTGAFVRAQDGAAALPADEREAEGRRAEILRSAATPEVAEAIRAGLAELGDGGGLLAVRSSAVGEDGGAASFAGQFETVLGVQPTEDAVWSAVRQVWASAFTPHALRYLREQGHDTARMAVVVQRLVEPQVSGVAFSLDPVTGERDRAVVSAVYGLGEGLVSGALDADTYRVRFPAAGLPAVDAAVADKAQAVRPLPTGGTAMVPVDADLRHQPALTDAEAVEVAAAVRALADRFGAPQDVEWALADGTDGARTLHVLQARPVTAAPAPAAECVRQPLDGERRTWDNQNIVEPFPGITLPLSFSIGGHVMGQVFAAFAEVMGAAEGAIAANETAFSDLLGLIRGRVYYNLRHYNRVISLVPGFRVQGDNVARAPMPPDPPGTVAQLAGSLPPALLLAARVMPMPAGLLRDTARVGPELERFRQRAAETLGPLAGRDFSAATVDELRAVYDTVDRGLLRHWHAPMLNDGLLDLWMNQLGQVVANWLPGVPFTLVNDLVAGDGGMISTEPLRRLADLAAAARMDASAAALLAGDADDAQVWRALTDDAGPRELREKLLEYVERFGDRCADEMKMEAVTYADDPARVIAALRAQVHSGDAGAPGGRGAELRAAAEALVRERLPAGRQVPFFAVLEQLRQHMRERENTRFERTRAMGVLRRAFLAMGAHLARAGALHDARDILYLTYPEVFAYLDGNTPGEIAPTAVARRAEFAAYATQPELPERFVTTGPPALSTIEPYGMPGMPMGPRPAGPGLSGMGCSAGVVRAPVRIVHDPAHAGDLTGRILVARQTDPGWTLLFAGAAGVLVQRGSLLSHAAIVAREMGIPCIVSIPDLLTRLSDCDVVEMDGATGTIRVAERAAG
jgi:rifampicin phosphotransferase